MLLTSVLRNLVRRSPRPAASDASRAGQLREAVAAHESGDVTRALGLVRGILSRQDDAGPAHYLAGLWQAQAGDFGAARPHLEKAAALMPADADVHLALGNVFKATGDRARAESSYRRAVALAPESAAGHYSLGLVTKAAGDHAAALAHFERACTLEPYIEDARRERVLALVALGRYAEAMSCGRAAVEHHPSAGELWSCLGYAHQKAHDPAGALECYARARALGVDDHEFHNNAAIVFQELGRMDEAVQAYGRSIEARPGHELARFHLALARLSMRQYALGWEGYELRLLSEENRIAVSPERAWRGEPLAGRSILIRGEQGLGDEIMFASCFAEVVEAASRCVITCAPRLERLFRRSFPAASVVGLAPDAATAVAGVDFEIPAGSLPRELRPAAADFPRHDGYLRADPERVAHWKTRLAGLGPGLKVGISWRGGTHKTRSPLRTLPLSAWSPILGVEGVRFVSVQYGDVREDLEHAPAVSHWQEAIDDYDETAALVCALDLVVSVCTAVIHLSGALGRPVWIMAPLSPEWRYAVAGDTMDWYPSSRMFRQQEFGNWRPVVARVAHELQQAAIASIKTSP